MALLLEQVRKALEASEISRYEIAKRTGIPQSTLSRFVNGKQKGLTAANLELLCDVLGLEVVQKKHRKHG